MPVCPNCHTEYRAGFTTCSDCGAKLVPDAPDESQIRPPEKKKRLLDADTKNRCSRDRFLANINDNVELAYIKSALSGLGIPYRALAEDISQYLYIMHGRGFMGIDIYVPDDSFTPACKALAHTGQSCCRTNRPLLYANPNPRRPSSESVLTYGSCAHTFFTILFRF